MAKKGKLKRRLAGQLFSSKQRSVVAKQHTAADNATLEHSLAPDHQPDHIQQGDQPPCLRLRGKNLENRDESNHMGNRIISLDQLPDIISTVSNDHWKPPINCEAMQLILHSERKVGLGSDLTFACSRCQFVSKPCRTYRPRVGKTQGAAINLMLASGLQDTCIGVEKANILLSSMDIPPPSRSHLQTLFNVASTSTISLNREDMSNKRKWVIKQNQDKGASDPRQLDLSFDCRYNATRMVSSYKPGQSGSQAYGVAIENHSEYKFVLGLAIENKLCLTGALLKRKHYDQVVCPGGHAGCTANIPYMQPHSERRMAHEVAQQLWEDDIVVRTLTTDGDTRGFLGMQDFYDDLGHAWNVTRQADPFHLGSTQIRHIRKANWSRDMFPNKVTRQARQQAVGAFARDIKSRCSKLVAKLRTLGDGDLRRTLPLLPSVCSATVECYAGNCGFCPHRSLVCDGLGGIGDWWFQSEFLPTHNINSLKMTEDDKDLLRSILQIRLSEQAIINVASNTDTQKCEAFNRGVLSTLPKEVNYSRNFAGKLASKTLQLNNSLLAAIEAKVSLITGEKLSPKPRRYLRQRSRVAAARKRLQKTSAFKVRRRKRRAELEHTFHSARTGAMAEVQDEYVKGQLDIMGC